MQLGEAVTALNVQPQSTFVASLKPGVQADCFFAPAQCNLQEEKNLHSQRLLDSSLSGSPQDLASLILLKG